MKNILACIMLCFSTTAQTQIHKYIDVEAVVNGSLVVNKEFFESGLYNGGLSWL